MKLNLFEHQTYCISESLDIESNNAFVFTKEQYIKVGNDAVKVFKIDRGRKIYPYKLSAKDSYYDLEANYYIGIDWLIKGEKYIQVEPKLNKAVTEKFAEKSEITDEDEINFYDISEIEKTEIEIKIEENNVEIDYLSILLDLSSNSALVNKIPEIFKIDWDATQIPIEQKDDQLTPFLIVQFLQTLKSIVRKGLKKSYYKVQENLTNRIKGKILVGNHIKQNVFKNCLTKTYCEYEEFGVDTLENKFLKKVLEFSIKYVQNDRIFFTKCKFGETESSDFKNQLLDIINYCRPAFERVSSDIKEQELKHIKYNPFFKEYKNAIKIGGYILKKFSYNISNVSQTKITTPPFWIDMPILFELYFYNQLLRSNPTLTKDIHYQFSTYGNSLDILISNENCKMVVDTKYKLKYVTSEIHQDIRQVSGYARLNKVRSQLKLEEENIDNVVDCLIVYPDLNAPKNVDFTLEYVKNNMKPLEAYHKVYKLGISLPII